MSTQQHGLPPCPGSQDLNDQQLWRQRHIQNQLQLQRQRQILRLDKREKMQGMLSLPYVAEKEAATNQLPTFLIGMSTNNASNYLSSNAMGDSEPKNSGNSEMLSTGYINWAEGRGSPLLPGSNGLMFSDDQYAKVRSIGWVAEQADQSLFGKPISSIRGSLSSYSHFEGISPYSPDMMISSGGNQVGMTGGQLQQLNSFQNEQYMPELGCLNDGISVSSGLSSGSLQRNLSGQKLQPRHEQANRFCNSLENIARTAEPSHVVTSLDPIEEKILLGTDDEYICGSFGGSMGMITGGPLTGNLAESNNCFGTLPTIHSGSWSALMQEAVQACSSENGLQEEWSGLSFQNIGPPTLNGSGVTNNSGKQQVNYGDDSLHVAASCSSRPVTLSNAADSCPNCQSTRGFLHSSKSSNNYNDQVPTDTSCESFQQSSTMAQCGHFNLDPQPKHLSVGYAHSQGHMHDHGVSEHLHHDKNAEVEYGATCETLLVSNDNPHLTTISQISSSSSSCVPGSPVLPYYQVGSSSMNEEPVVFTSQISYSQWMQPSFIQGLKDQNQGYVEYPSLAGQVQNAEKDPSTENLSTTVVPEISCRDTISYHDSEASASFDGRTVHAIQDRNSEASQNMFQLLHSVDGPRKSYTDTPLDFSDPTTMIQIPEASTSNGSSLHPHNSWSSISRNLGLQSTPQRKPGFDFNVRQTDPWTIIREGNQLASTVSAQPQPPTPGVPQRESLNAKSNLSGQRSNKPSHSSTQGHFSALTGSDSSFIANELNLKQQFMHQQQTSSEVGCEDKSVSINNASRCQIDSPAHANVHPFCKQENDSHGTIAIHSIQTPLPGIAGKASPLMLSSAADTQSPASEFCNPDKVHSQMMNKTISHLTSSLQQPPVADSAHQRLSGAQHQRAIAVVPPTAILSSRNKDSCAPQVAIDESDDGGSSPLDLVACSISSQQLGYAEDHYVEEISLGNITSKGTNSIAKMGSASQGSESVSEHISDVKPALSYSTSAKSHQHNISREKHVQDSSLGSQAEHTSFPNISPSVGRLSFRARSMEPSDVQLPNHSLLQQVQSMKFSDYGTDKRAEKRFRGAGFVSGVSQVDSMAGQSSICRQNGAFRVMNGDIGADLNGSSTSDDNMSTFSSDQHYSLNQTQPLCSMSNFMQRRWLPQGDNGHQFASTLFERYWRYKNGQMFSILDEQKSDNAAAQQFSFTEPFQSMGRYTPREQMESRQFGSLGQYSLYSGVPSYGFSSCTPYIEHFEMKRRPRKRKHASSKLLPWHMEVTICSRRLPSISMAEHSWVLATNRLFEKVDDEDEMIDDGLSRSQSRRRLVLTTQLMQQILFPMPYAILSDEAIRSYESVIYLLTKSVLGDACGLISYPGGVLGLHSEHGYAISEKSKVSEKASDIFLLKVLEHFLGELSKLENDFSRFVNWVPMLEFKVECQELDSFSIINRLVKFHGRGHMDVKGSLVSEASHHKIFPERYVMALPMPRDLPEGVFCLSL